MRKKRRNHPQPRRNRNPRAGNGSACKRLVRKGGLEPPWVSPPDPKSGASANSATLASCGALQNYTAMPAGSTRDYSEAACVRSGFFRGKACPERRQRIACAAMVSSGGGLEISLQSERERCSNGREVSAPSNMIGGPPWLCLLRPPPRQTDKQRARVASCR